MAKNLTYISNHDGNRKWLLGRFEDSDKPESEYIYLCQMRDSNPNSHEIVIIPKDQWQSFVDDVNAALKEFK